MWFFLFTSEKSTVGIYWNNAAETWIDIRSTTADKVCRQSSYTTQSLIFLSKNEGMFLCGWSVGRHVGCQYLEIHCFKVCQTLVHVLTKVDHYTQMIFIELHGKGHLIYQYLCKVLLDQYLKFQILDSHQTAYKCWPQSYGF